MMIIVGIERKSLMEMSIMVQKKVRDYIEKYHMIETGDHVFAAVSGGADSVCMLLLLESICKEKKAELELLHVNHLIRKEAGRDEDYVCNLCKLLNLKYRVLKVDVIEEARKMKCGTEEAGRIIRYDFFKKCAEAYGERAKIAVAHNRNDLAETSLFHLFRGSSVLGLAGILPVRGQIIRPILLLNRFEIEEFLAENDIVKGEWCHDVTNSENDYSRNKIRNELIPYVEENICKQAGEHVAKLAEDVAELRDFLEDLTLEAYKKTVLYDEKEEKIRIKLSELENFSKVIQKQLLMNCIEKLAGSRKDITATHIESLLSLKEKESGRKISLPYNCIAEKSYDDLLLKKVKEKKEEITVSVEPQGTFLVDGREFRFRLISVEEYRENEQKTYTKSFDYDKINNCLVVRNRKKGDYLIINQKGNRKSLKDYLINEKVPRDERDQLLVLADGEHVLWVVGKRISEHYKVSSETRRVLEVTVK